VAKRIDPSAVRMGAEQECERLNGPPFGATERWFASGQVRPSFVLHTHDASWLV
jgi:hypothetical protein